MISEYGSFSSASMGKNIIQLPTSEGSDIYCALDENVDISELFLIYELYTPSTVQLTPTEIKTFKKHTNKFRIRASYATEASYYTMEGGSCEIAKQFMPIFYPNGKGVNHNGSTF